MRFSGKRWLSGALAAVLMLQQLVPMTALAEDLSSGEEAVYAEDTAYSVMSSEEDITDDQDLPELEEADLVDPDEEYPDEEYPDEEYPDEDIVLSDGSDGSAWEEGDEYPGTPSEEDGTQDPDAEDMDESGSIDEEAFDEEDEELEEDDEDLLLSSAPLVGSTLNGVFYINADGDPATAPSCTRVEEDVTAWKNGWYVVEGDVTIDTRVKVTKDVSLILADGAKLTVPMGIEVNGTSTNALHIYAQEEGTGALVSGGSCAKGAAGIGGKSGMLSGPISIHGGTITARGGLRGAGIGGGLYSDATDMMITGGTVTAVGGDQAAGIGGGYQGGCQKLWISKGTITAIAGNSTASASKAAEAIGTGQDPTAGSGTLSFSLYDGAEIRAGSDEDHVEIYFSDDVGVDACRNNPYVRISQATEGIRYIDKDGIEWLLSVNLFKRITADTVTWDQSWYAVTGDITIRDRVLVSGNINLVLGDGARLNASKGITVPEGCSIRIFGQKEQSGRLVAEAGSYSGAGIGSENEKNAGTIELYGGRISAVGGPGAPGIGGARNGSAAVIIGRGEINAAGGSDGAGIGGGADTSVTINGGTVIATGNGGGAGIGGNNYRNGGTVNITDGTVTATGGENGAGIGGGRNGDGGSIEISGGTVEASGSRSGAGIGGGNGGKGASITVRGGSVTASGGGYGGCGIGGGNNGAGGDVTLTGGIVLATGGGSDMAIGGEGMETGTIRFADMRVFAGGSPDTLSPVKVGPGNDIREQECHNVCARIDLCEEHAAAEGYVHNEEGHWNVCANCMTPLNGEYHRYREYADKNKEEKYTFEPVDETWHQRECEVCGYIEKGLHSYDTGDLRCQLCGGGEIVVTYVDANGTKKQHKGCLQIHGKDADGTEVFELNDELFDGFYMVKDDVEIENRMTVDGKVNLVLCDGASLTATKGIEVNSGNTLTIWRQEKGTGKLYARGSSGNAGIGGADDDNGGTIVINGGNIIAIGGENAAGIGAGSFLDDPPTEKVIKGSTYYFLYCNGLGATVTINGGSVDALGGAGGAGIGGGRYCAGGTITITGGTVKARGSAGAGIGGGEKGTGGTITISGGDVSASGDTGAGIGSGHEGSHDRLKKGTVITITNGAKVDAYSSDATAIGLARCYYPVLTLATPCEVNILSGRVKATSRIVFPVGVSLHPAWNPSLSSARLVKITLACNRPSDYIWLNGPTDNDIYTLYYRIPTYRGHKLDIAPGSGYPLADKDTNRVINQLVDGWGYVSCWDLGRTYLVPATVYYVHFDGNGADGFMEDTAADPASEYRLPESGFYPPYGKYFSGWRADVDGSLYQSGEVFTSNVYPKDITFKAEWEDGYGIWVGNRLITPQNAKDVFGDGSVSYDDAAKKLKLSDLSKISVDRGDQTGDQPYKHALIYAEDRDLNIELDDAAVSADELTDYGIRVVNGELHISGAAGGDGTLQVEGAKIGICADEKVVIEDLRRLTVLEQSGNGIGIQSKNASVELRRNNLSAYSAMQYEITGGTGIEGNGVSIQDISLVTAKSTAPKGYGIRSYSWVNLTRTTSYTRIDAHGGTAGVYADNMITQQDSDLRASGDAYGIYTGRGLTLLRRETSVRATAESPGTGIYVGGYLRNEDGIVTSRGGKIGIESDGVYPRWMDTSYTDIKVDASGTVQAIKGPTQIEYAMEIQRPDEASMRSDGIILDKDGRPATDVLIVPREFEISFDPGEGSGTMASLYVTQDAETFLPRCSFTSPEPGLLFAGWKINGKIYGEGDAFTTADDVTAVAQWGFTWWTLQNLLKKGGEIVLPCDVTAGSADTYLSSTRDAVIDLNGHTIDRGLNSIRSDGQVFRVTDGTLTIKDSTGEGRITGGKASGNGGAVLISGGSFILEGGTITGNEAAPEESGKQIYGGAVYVDHGTFTMTGGALSGNKAESAGSAVFVANSDARFVMTGGTVTDNYARYGCAVLPRDGSFEISGSPVITGNRMLQGTKTSDYDLYYLGSYMRRTKPILVTGALDENACINVGTSNFNYPVITSGLPGNGSYKSFVSSNPDYTVYPDENGEAALMTKKTLTFYADVAGSKVFLTQKVFPGEPLSQFLSQLSLEKEGFTAAGWTRQKTDQDAYSYKAAVPGDDAYCVDDLSTMEMPGQDTFFYPVLIRHRVQVHLDLGAIDTNANAQNLNGWENPPVYTDTETPASLAISQYRCFNVELGETIRMNEGMSAITRKGYDLDAWLTRNGTRWNSGWGADPQYCDTDNAGNPFLTKSSEYPYSYYTMTLRPAWKLKKATVRYDIGMGRGMVTTQSTATPYSTVTVIRTKPLPPDNYIFVGWRDKQGNVYKGGDTFVYDGFDKVTVITEGTGNNTIRLSAVYAKIPQGALLFDSGGGTNVDPIQKKPTDGSTSYQVTESEVISKQPTRTGYTFTGWYTTEECTEKVKFPMTITGDDNVTIYAGWEANEYRIELDYGPDAGMAVFMGHYGDPVNIPDPVKMHYRFDGWTPAKPAYMPAYNMRLTARWVPRYYTITFDLGGGSGTSYISAIYGASITAPADPEREGYVFAGWEPDIPSNMPDDNPVITARWMQLQDQPEAPVVKEVRDTSIEVVPEEGQEYAIRPADTAEKTEAYSWQLPDENGRMVFEDLVPSLWYRMVTRRAGDDTKLPSEISESALAKTRKSSQEKPAAPTLQAGLTYIEVVPAIEGQEYAIRTIGTPESTTLNYQKPDGDGRMVFDGLLQDTPYQVVTRVAETDTRYVSPVSDPAEIYTQKTTVESVRITGTQRFRETLTAVVQPEDAQDLAFSWYRTGSGGESEEITDAESRTYALTAEDIGKTITLVVLQTVRGGEDVTVSASSGTIRKGVGPEAPALSAEAEETTIKVTAPVQEDARFEYSLDNKTWQSAVSFANLTPGSTYTVYAREKETETHEAGKTASLRISTKLTTAEVYEIRQNADGSWPEPGDPLAARAVARYQVPEDTDAFTAHGYRFDTYIGTDAGTRACSAGAAIVLPPGTQRLYIYYSRNSYDLIFHADIAGEKVSAVYQVLHGASLEYYAEESILPDGCTFAGWTEKPKTDGEYSWREGMAGTEECVLSDLTVMTMPAGEKHFYPVLIPHRIQVHLDVGAVDANADETNMNGWTNPVTYEDEDTAAVMDKAQYRSFTTNPGEKLRMDGGMNSAARAGYVLDGWYTSGGVQWTADMGTDPEYCDKNEDGEVLLTKHPDRPYSYYTITLTAAWALRWADIVYDTAEGNGDVTGDTPVIPYGRVIVTDQTPVPPKGYGFIGWADKTGHLYKAGQNFAYHNLSRVTALGTGDDNNTITLTAQYAEIPQGSLFFDTQGGTQVEPIHKEAAPGSGSYPVTEEEAVDRVTTREGYTFAGWVTAPGGDRKVTWPVQIGSQDVTIYASWTPNTYTITFESMGGSKIPSITLPYGEKLPAPAPVPERLHYVFEGWKPVLPETMPAYDLTVQAAWTPQKYTISFDTAGGNAIDPIEDIYGARVTPPADPVREGYTFTGWEQEIPAYMPDTDPIIRARWKQNQTAPAAPVVTAVTDTSIEVEAEEGQEYAIERISEEAAGGSGDTDDEDPAQGDPSGTDEEKNWQMPDESGRMIFTDLLPATAYRIVTRRAGSDTKMPSEASRPTVQTTNKSTQEAPGTPALVAGRTDIEVIPVLKGLEYSIDGGTTWQKPDTDGRMVFDGLSEDTEYSVLARRAETETKYASEASPASRIFTAKTLLDVIRVTGLPKYGVTLTTAVTPADAADITYQWYRTDASGDDFPGTAISGATGTTYALTAADIGQIITVRAVQTVRGGEDVTAQDTLAQVIRKADGPASPEVQAESDETTITVTAPAQSGNRYEYSLDGNTWQEEPLFEGLMPGTAYLVHAREKETAEQNAGEPGTARVETKKTIADVYEVFENVDGGFTEPGKPLTDKAEGSYVIPARDAFTVSGYTFGSFEADTSSLVYAREGDEVDLPAGTTKLYIYYRRNVHTLTFYEDITGTAKKTEYQVRTGVTLSDYADESVVPVEATFAGWTDTPRTEGTYDWEEGKEGNEKSVLVDVGSYTMPDADLSFYPVLIPHRILVHLDVGAVDRNADSTNMNGWTNPVSYEDTDTQAEMDASQYRSFFIEAGEKLRMDEGMNGVSRDGFVLDGWYTAGGVKWNADRNTDPEYCEKNTEGTPVLTKHPDRPYSYYTLTLTAGWALRWADVVYDVAEGSGTISGDTHVIPYGRVIITDKTPEPPEGYAFLGWTDKNDYLYKAGQNFGYYNLSKVTTLGTGDADNTIKLTAQYAAIPQGSLIFDSQGGTLIEPIHKDTEPGAVLYTVSKEEISSKKPDREGFAFTGWYFEPWCQNIVDGDVIITGNENETIYAGWQVKSFTITYDSKGGTEVDKQVISYDQPVVAPSPAPIREHYDFDGWKPALPDRMPAYDLTEEAMWTPVTYMIYFDTDGGSVIDPVKGIYGSRVTAPADPVREGYTFTGWKQTIPPYMPDTNPTIEATWKQNQTAPEAPVVKDFTDTTIEVVAEEGQEYAIERISGAAVDGSGDTDDEDPAQGDPSGTDEEKNWQLPDESGRMIFSDLSPATAYRIVTRRAGSDTRMPSASSRPTVQTTKKSTQEAPGAPTLVAGRTSIEVIPVMKGLAYSIDGGATWQKPDTDGRMVFDGLSVDTEYSVLARRAETETKYASESSPEAKIFTGKTLLDVIRVTGSPKYGETLTAELSPADASDVAYQWYRADASGDDFPGTAISGATGTTYALTAADIGQIITVRAVQTVRGGEDVTTQDTLAQVIRKADGPASPEVQAESDETTITVTAPAQSGNRYEYSLDGTTWQEEPLFEGLMPGTAYLVHAREKETAEQNAGEPGTVRVDTKKTTADVYEVFETVDGGFTEPGKPLTGKAEGSYVIPARDGFTVTGYRFGSFEADTSSLVNAREGDEVDLPAGTKKLYIYYRRNVHTLTFYEDIAGTAKKTEYQVRTGMSLSGYAAESVAPVEATFAGWTDTPRTEGTYDWEEGKEGNEKSVLVDVGSYTMPDADLSFYPVLIPHRILVHLDVGAVDRNADSTNMNGWTNPVVYTDTDTAAVMNADQYRSFTTNAGEKLRMDEGMNSVTRPGYVPDGWYTKSGVRWEASFGTDPEYCDRDEDGVPILTKDPERPYSFYTLTLTADWALRWADVVYDTAEGSGMIDGETPVIPYGRVIITDETPEPPSGYDFAGWKDRSGHLYKAGQSFGYYDLNNVTVPGTESGNNTITLTAQYVPAREAVLILDTQGGLMLDPIRKHVAPGETACEVTEAEVAEKVPTREGYTFAGWVTEPGGTSSVVYPIRLEEKAVTIYAAWAPNEYTVTFDSKGGSEIPPATYACGEEIREPSPAPERLHYDFAGWSPALTPPVTMPAHDLVLEARWTPKTYTITFDTDGGSKVEPIVDIYGARITHPEAPVREGYVFTGWDPEIPTFMPDTDPTIRAVFKQKQEPPEAPVVMDVTDTTIQIRQVTGQEYALLPADASASGDEPWIWQRSGLFTGLSPATEYRIVTRMAENAVKLPSQASKPVYSTTDKSDQAAPAAPGAIPDLTSIEVTPVTPGMEYAVEPADQPQADDEARVWQRPDKDGKVIFEGLSEDTKYRVVARWVETEVQKASPASAPSEVYTQKTLLSGASLTGKAAYGDTLTVSVEPANAADLSYKWYRRDPADGLPDEGETPGEALDSIAGASYGPVAADVGKEIYVKIVQHVNGGSDVVKLLHAGPVDKLEGPAAPAVEVEAGRTAITIVSPAQTGKRYEYSLDGKTWQTEPEFGGLVPGQTYTVFARTRETDFQKPGKAGTLQVATLKNPVEVWEIFQNVDGSWPLPDAPAARNASGAWVLPEDPEGFTATGYTLDILTEDMEKRTAVSAKETVTFPAEMKTLYVYYTRRSFTLSFCSDIEGTTVQSSHQVYYGASLAPYADEKVILEGFTFDGWSETPKTDGPYRWREADPDSAQYKAADPASMTMPVSDKTFYPILVAHRVAVHLDPGAVDAYADDTNMNGWENPVTYKDDDTPAYLAASQDRSFVTDEGEKLRMEEGMNRVSRDGYALQGWYTSDGIRWEAGMGTNVSYCDRGKTGEPVLSVQEKGLYAYYTITLTARWSPREITVSYGDAAPDDHTRLGEILKLPSTADAPAGQRLSAWEDKKGNLHAAGEDFLFDDWKLTENMRLSFTPVFTDIPQYGVIFDTDGGSYIESVTVPEGGTVDRPYDPVRTGWLFTGWYLEEDKVSFPITDIRSTITLKAGWSRRAYTLIFDTKGGDPLPTMTLEFGEKVEVPDPVREGYSFGGWTPALPKTMPAYDLILEASWSPMVYFIYFDTDGGTEIPPVRAYYGEKVTAPADPEKEGYTFAGWDREIPEFMPDTNPTIRAKWTEITPTPADEPEDTVTPTPTDEAEKGHYFVEQEENGDLFVMDVKNLTESLARKMASSDEKDRVEEGEDFTLTLVITNIDDTISDDDKDLLSEAMDGAKAALYMDLSVFKKIGGDDPVRITDLEGNKIKVTLTIPESLQAKKGVDRTWYIARVHDGKAAVLADSTGNTITFETDKFSSYALGYSDSSDDADVTPTKKGSRGTNRTDAGNGAADHSDIDGDRAARTGDDTQAGFWLLLMACAAVMACFAADRKKKRS